MVTLTVDLLPLFTAAPVFDHYYCRFERYNINNCNDVNNVSLLAGHSQGVTLTLKLASFSIDPMEHSCQWIQTDRADCCDS